ncbi:MAG: hypothetical protein K2M95_06205 [Clostridiales bacterium]|nr:hypothetical protein [Clostridiales bacterium]
MLINIRHKKTVRPNYDFSTGAAKSWLIFAHTGFGISFSVIASEIIICFFRKNQIALWTIFGIFTFFALLELLLLYELYFTYEAIRGDEVYIRRFFGMKKIKVSDIRRIDARSLLIEFYDKNNKCLFRADSITQGIHELIRLINERKSDGSNEDYQEDALAEGKAILAKIGQEYRANYKERKKKFKIKFLVVSIVILLALVLLMYFIGIHTFEIVEIGLLGALALALIFFSVLTGMKKELDDDDVSLGNRYKFANKKVKGANRSKFKIICILCVCCMALGATLLIPLCGVLEKAPNYDEYTHITGKLEYYRENFSKHGYIAIGFYDIPTEYRLSSLYLDEFDYSFFNEVKAGDTVTIYIDNAKDRKFSLGGVSKKQWNSFYYLATDSKEYFTYEDYVKSNKLNDRAGFILVGVGIAILVAATITLISARFVCKKREKEETIVIYQ